MPILAEAEPKQGSQVADIKTQPPASFVVVQSNPQARSSPCHPLHSYSPTLPLPAAASCRRLLLPLLLLLHNFRQSTSVCACLLVAAPVCVCALSQASALSFSHYFRSLPLSTAHSLLLTLCCSLSVAACSRYICSDCALAGFGGCCRSLGYLLCLCVGFAAPKNKRQTSKRKRQQGQKSKR